MRALALALALALAGCGFQLRGAANVPFESVYVSGATGGIALDLKRQIEAGTKAKVLDDPKGAEAILSFDQETRDKEILSLTGTGRVREFRLNYRVTFRLSDGKGGSYIAPSTITISRDVPFNDAELLARETEEQLLFRDMQADMVQQILRRIAAAQKPVATVK